MSRESRFSPFYMESKQLQKLIELPSIANISNLAEMMHLSEDKLKAIARNSRPFYRRFDKYKRTGGIRKIYEPNKDVKAIQAWILQNVIYKLNPSMYATAYRINYSLLDNVRFHQKQRYFICLDLKDFFPSINLNDVVFFFTSIGYEKRVAVFLSRLCTCDNLLPQGAITSPALSNFVSYKLDKRIAGLCSKKHIVYSRYADDITLSSNNRNLLNYSASIIKEIIINEGFEINDKKVRVLGPKIQCKITGLIKNSAEPKFAIGKKRINHMRSVFYNLLINTRIIDWRYTNINSALGWLSFVKTIDNGNYEYMKRYINRLRPGTVI